MSAPAPISSDGLSVSQSLPPVSQAVLPTQTVIVAQHSLTALAAPTESSYTTITASSPPPQETLARINSVRAHALPPGALPTAVPDARIGECRALLSEHLQLSEKNPVVQLTLQYMGITATGHERWTDAEIRTFLNSNFILTGPNIAMSGDDLLTCMQRAQVLFLAEQHTSDIQRRQIGALINQVWDPNTAVLTEGSGRLRSDQLTHVETCVAASSWDKLSLGVKARANDLTNLAQIGGGLLEKVLMPPYLTKEQCSYMCDAAIHFLKQAVKHCHLDEATIKEANAQLKDIQTKVLSGTMTVFAARKALMEGLKKTYANALFDIASSLRGNVISDMSERQTSLQENVRSNLKSHDAVIVIAGAAHLIPGLSGVDPQHVLAVYEGLKADKVNYLVLAPTGTVLRSPNDGPLSSSATALPHPQSLSSQRTAASPTRPDSSTDLKSSVPKPNTAIASAVTPSVPSSGAAALARVVTPTTSSTGLVTAAAASLRRESLTRDIGTLTKELLAIPQQKLLSLHFAGEVAQKYSRLFTLEHQLAVLNEAHPPPLPPSPSSRGDCVIA